MEMMPRQTQTELKVWNRYSLIGAGGISTRGITVELTDAVPLLPGLPP